jgi:hypothetical protein
MTAIPIDDTMIGLIIARDGIWSKLTMNVAGQAYSGPLTLVDDFGIDPRGPSGIARQLFSSDLLGQVGPICFQDAQISFRNLTVRHVPNDGMFVIETSGALSNAEISEQRRALIERNRWPDPPPPTEPAYRPPENYVEQPPPPPDPELLLVEAEALTLWRQQEHWPIKGKPLDQIRTELLIALQRRRRQEASP